MNSLGKADRSYDNETYANMDAVRRASRGCSIDSPLCTSFPSMRMSRVALHVEESVLDVEDERWTRTTLGVQ
jgi:hypothetical protein